MIKIKSKIFLSSISSLFIFTIALASQSSGTITSNTYSQAVVCTTTPCPTFSGNYINFKPTASTTLGVTPITIDDTNGIDGYAFGNYLGWINFGRTGTSTVTINTTTGAISGYAWAQNSGWINMAPTSYGVTINSSGEWNGYAWAAGQNGGWIKFDCGGGATSTCVKTDWVPTGARSVPSPSGGGGGGGIVIDLNNSGVQNNGTFQSQTGLQNQKLDYSGDFRADINDSGLVDIYDYNSVIVNWNKSAPNVDMTKSRKDRCPNALPADVNCDAGVDLLDFNLVMVYWGTYIGDQGVKLKSAI